MVKASAQFRSCKLWRESQRRRLEASSLLLTEPSTDCLHHLTSLALMAFMISHENLCCLMQPQTSSTRGSWRSNIQHSEVLLTPLKCRFPAGYFFSHLEQSGIFLFADQCACEAHYFYTTHRNTSIMSVLSKGQKAPLALPTNIHHTHQPC